MQISNLWKFASPRSLNPSGLALAPADQDELDARFRAAQVEALYGALGYGLALTPVGVGVVMLFLWNVVPHTALLLWGAASFVPFTIRLWLLIDYRKSADSGVGTEYWLQSFIISMALQAALFGVVSWVIYPETNLIAQATLIVILMGGVAGGGVLLLLGHWPTAAIHVLLVLVPLAGKFLYGTIFPAYFAVLTILFAVVMVAVARDFSLLLNRSLRAQLEKGRLADDLSAAKREAEVANKEKAIQTAKAAEQRLQAALDREAARSAAFLQSVLENINEALVAFNHNGLLTMMTKQLHQITGLPAQLCEVGAPIDEVFRYLLEHSSVGDIEDAVRRVTNLRDQRNLRYFEYRSPSGRDVEVRTSAMPDGGMVVTLVDATERKRAEREMTQLQKMESLGNFVGGMAHNLNNLLLPILSLSRRTLNELPEGDERQYMEKVVQAGERAKNLVGQVVAFSREEEVGSDLIDIAEVLGSSMELIQSTLPTTIKVKEELSDSVGFVLGNPAQIATILMNLVSNAIDAMAGGVGELEVSLSRVEISREARHKSPFSPPIGSYALLTVTDSGPGMDQATMNRIFDPFFTTKDVGAGTGLGLSTAYATVTRQGGTINVASNPGSGTKFDVFFPLASLTQNAGDSSPSLGSH